MFCTEQSGVLTIDAEKYTLSLGVPPEPSRLWESRKYELSVTKDGVGSTSVKATESSK